MSHESDGEDEDHHSEGGHQVSEGHGHDDSHADEAHHDSGIGKPGDANSVDRVISVVMDDTMRFIPDSFEVVAGETIQFYVVNQGKLAHEFVLGSAEEIKEHHELMKKFPGMEHDEPNSISLDTNGAGTVTWSFTNAGVVDIACLKPGHLEGGMKGSVTVQ
ncbi:hypothetical protein IMCC3135_18145 [Granulosicoccus antarcticus IMCC3135]|uniref:Blue (type 1) copper domain-containing protein n=2 Tax=Granulosicoccus TaxID=437504 RepID=A0A2Z2NVF4_9GAMM|nr:hypothetical protein IMCC3135_18145 [Granulosicoccus antarcticus IMCC3135]